LTGKAGDKSTDLTYRAQLVENQIFSKKNVGTAGDDDLDDEVDEDPEGNGQDEQDIGDQEDGEDEDLFGPNERTAEVTVPVIQAAASNEPSFARKRTSENSGGVIGKTKNSKHSVGQGTRGGSSKLLQNIGDSIHQLANSAAGGAQMDMMQMMLTMHKTVSK
jgi:hypothetical protein